MKEKPNPNPSPTPNPGGEDSTNGSEKTIREAMSRVDGSREGGAGDLLDGKVQPEEPGTEATALDLGVLDAVLVPVLAELSESVLKLAYKWRGYLDVPEPELCAACAELASEGVQKYLGQSVGEWIAENPRVAKVVTLLSISVLKNEAALAISRSTATKDTGSARLDGQRQDQSFSGLAQAA